VRKPIRHLILKHKIDRELVGNGTTVESPVEVHHTNNDLRILLAEDNLTNQKVVLKLLASIGYSNVEVVENGKEVLIAVSNSKFDLILMDCMMPEMGGIECTEIIRKSLPASRQPTIIALTAHAFQEEKDKCLQAGMNDVLTKPVNRTLLEAALLRCPKLS